MKKHLLKKLSAYSAMAASTIAIQKESNAQVVYTDIPDTLLTQETNFLFLDLNNDGIFDLRFKAGNFNETYLSVLGLAAGNSVLASTVSSSFSVVYPVKLDYFDPIDANQPWPQTLIYGFLAGGTGGDANFEGATDGYLGVRFMIGAEQHYGWIRLDVNADAEWLLIKDFAYNATPDAPITAGQCFCPPNPGCQDLFEPNNSLKKATPIIADVEYSGLIDKGTDHDFYQFEITAPGPNLKISLSNLPKNYNLLLLDAAGKIIGKSIKSQTQDEAIVFNNAVPGKYYGLVYPKDNSKFDPANCYSMMLETSMDPFRISEETEVAASVKLGLYPNPVSDIATIEFSLPEKSNVIIDLFDISGRKIETITEGNFETGNHQFLFQQKNLKAGIYLLQLKTGATIVTQKFIIQ